MIRKFISVGLGSIGVLALLGAGVVQEEETSNQNMNTNYVTASLGANFANAMKNGETIAPQVENQELLWDGAGVEDDVEDEILSQQTDEDSSEGFEPEELETEHKENSENMTDFTEDTPQAPVVTGGDTSLLINGFPANTDINRTIIGDVTYVSLLAMAKMLDSSAECAYNPNTGLATIVTDSMFAEAKAGQYYLMANGRYLYIEETVQKQENDLLVPLSVVVRAFDAQLSWDPETKTTSVVTGSGAILSGDEFYDKDDLFWLSRVIFAESGNEPVKGQMGVAIVVYNRVNNPQYPDTVLGVLSQRNQFTTYQNGGLANRTPNASSIIAAKLVMDGGVVTELAHATHFDSLAGSWADRNLSTIMVIGGHTFYA